MSEDALRKVIRETILSEFLRTTDLLDIVVRLRVSVKKESDPMVNDIITNIRILPGVSIARQVSPVRHVKGGNDVLQIQIKYANSSTDMSSMMDKLGEQIRHLPGVDIAMFLTIGGREVRKDDGTPYIY